jgi:hypothetical protein
MKPVIPNAVIARVETYTAYDPAFSLAMSEVEFYDLPLSERLTDTHHEVIARGAAIPCRTYDDAATLASLA